MIGSLLAILGHREVLTWVIFVSGILSSRDLYISDERRELEIKAACFWQPVLQTVELPNSLCDVRGWPPRSLEHLCRADGALMVHGLSLSAIASDAFWSGGQYLLSSAIKRCLGGVQFLQRLGYHLLRCQAGSLPALRGATDATDNCDDAASTPRSTHDDVDLFNTIAGLFVTIERFDSDVMFDMTCIATAAVAARLANWALETLRKAKRVLAAEKNRTVKVRLAAEFDNAYTEHFVPLWDGMLKEADEHVQRLKRVLMKFDNVDSLKSAFPPVFLFQFVDLKRFVIVAMTEAENDFVNYKGEVHKEADDSFSVINATQLLWKRLDSLCEKPVSFSVVVSYGLESKLGSGCCLQSFAGGSKVSE